MPEFAIQTFLAFDVGLKRTGVARGQNHTKSANPAGQLLVNRGRMDWSEVDELIKEWEPAIIIIGDPKSDDPQLKKVINRLKSHIQQQHKIPIVDVDETLSTSAANAEFDGRQHSIKRKTELRDQLAACLILESYLSTLD
ncbi:MAG: putative Holliday junction resolvase [Arenicella sp.]|jgi:putative Holliday junction resolvase